DAPGTARAVAVDPGRRRRGEAGVRSRAALVHDAGDAGIGDRDGRRGTARIEPAGRIGGRLGDRDRGRSDAGVVADLGRRARGTGRAAVIAIGQRHEAATAHRVRAGRTGAVDAGFDRAAVGARPTAATHADTAIL